MKNEASPKQKVKSVWIKRKYRFEKKKKRKEKWAW